MNENDWITVAGFLLSGMLLTAPMLAIWKPRRIKVALAAEGAGR